MRRTNKESLLSLTVGALVLAGSISGAGNAAAAGAQSPVGQGQSSQTLQFADPAFESLWRRTDSLVNSGKVKRSFFWGPKANTGSLSEDYAQGPGGKHMVQYFDKSRMEINNPNADKKNPFYVTNGLLTMELISGMMQLGDNDFELRWPANIPLASDTNDTNAPTYTSFKGAIARTDTNNVGKVVISIIDKSGSLDFEHGAEPYGAYDRFNVKNAYYEATTKHNIPDVFWTFLNSNGPVLNSNNQQTIARLQDPYFYATGYPIADAYWSSARIEGKVGTAVLIQPFQRRVLTYVPSAPEGFKVQMGNIGQHYYDWRYKGAGKPDSMTGKCAVGSPKLGFGKVYENNTVKFQLGCETAGETHLTVERQQFEHGQMLGVTSYDFYTGHNYEDVFVLFEDGTAFTSSHINADDVLPAAPPPPPGVIPSTRSFGLVLALNNSALRQRLGDPTAAVDVVQATRDPVTGTNTGGSPVQYFEGITPGGLGNSCRLSDARHGGGDLCG